MKFKVPRYEVRYHGKVIWEDISGLALMQSLQETYGRLTQLIRQMFEGKKVQTPEAGYRLKTRRMFNFYKVIIGGITRKISDLFVFRVFSKYKEHAA